MSNFETADRERLVELQTEQLEMFEQIYKLCEEQTELLSEDKLEELDKSLGKSQELREKINGLHQETEKLMQSYVSASKDRKDSGVEELIAKIQEKIEMCAKLNAKNMKAIEGMKENQKTKIDDQRAKREGITGYAQPVASNPEMFDKKT